MKNNKFFILLGIILAIFLATLDQMIVSTAMPKILHDLNGIEHLSWVFTAYMLTSTITMAIVGKLADLLGHKKLFIAGILIFLAGSALSGLAQDMGQLIAFRAIQGIGGGAVMIIAFALIADVFPPAEQARYQGMIGGIGALSSIIGPLMGGWITDNWSWRWTFYINVPIGIIALIVIIGALPAVKHHVKAKSIDFAGSFFITAMLIPFLLALVWAGNTYAWDSKEIILLLAGAAVALAAFIITENRAKHPILAPDLFKSRVFITAALSTFITSMGMFGVILFVPIFAQGIVGITATRSGLILTPMMVSLIVAAMISGQIISRTGKYKWNAIAGMVIASLGLYLFSTINMETTNGELSLRMAVLGAGLGLTIPIFQLCAINAFPVTRAGEVTAGSQLFKGLGGTVGLALLGGYMNTQITTKMESAGSEPFVAMAQKMNPAKPMQMDAKTLQAFLSPEAQAKVKGMIAKAPAPIQETVSKSFEHFMHTVKTVFCAALDNVFAVSMIIMLAGFVVVLFLPQIPLRKTNAVEEAAQEAQMAEDIAQMHA